MAQQINDNFEPRTPKPLDRRYSLFSGGLSIPFSSIASANAVNSRFYRYIGMTVLIDSGSGRQEYWYRDGIEDTDLILKSSSLPTLADVAYSGLYSDLIGAPNLSLYYLASNPQGFISSIDSSDVTTALGFTPENIANKGIANGYASLDSAGKIPFSALPNSIFKYLGTWNASTNTPTLVDGIGDAGDLYRVSVAGTYNFGSGPITFTVGDYVIYNGTNWERSGSTDAVSSVNGLTGDVVLTTSNIVEGTNQYYTNAKVQTFADTRYLQKPTGNINEYLRGDGTVGGIGPGLTTVAGILRLNTDFTTLVSPTISTTWTLYRNDGTTPYSPSTSTSKNLIVDKGVRAFISSTYQYPNATTGQGNPTSVSGNYGTTLPSPATPSAPPFTNSGGVITSNTATTTTYSVTLSKPKNGLVVSGSNVIPATGTDTTTDSTSISFQGRGVLAFSINSSLTATEIQGFYNATIDSATNTSNNPKFQTTRARTFGSVTASGGTYTYYLLDAALGRPTSVIQNGALPVFGAFEFLTDVNIINAAGITVPITVMKSTATDAFVAANLAFS